jgi:hypothetical protein
MQRFVDRSKSIKFTQEADEQNVVVEQCKGPTGDIPQHKVHV